MNPMVVYLGTEIAGELVLKDNGNMQFRYWEKYTGPAISHALPRQNEAHPHSACLAVFGGLLPEGEGRQALARRFGISTGNTYALLHELGGDCAGAITVIEEDFFEMPDHPATRPLDAEDLDRIIRELPERPLAADPEAGTRLSLAGAQPKLPVIIDGGKISLPLNLAAATTHIIKPEPTAFPGLVDNEAFCMQLAQRIDLPVASVSKFQTVSGVACLLVDRYDRDPTADPIRRLHQEDFCQALGRPSERKYQDEGGPSAKQSVTLLRDASAVPAQDLPTFWRALVFNWLIGNCDAHAKNFSLLYDAGAPTLAPLYDLVSTTIYDGLKRRLAMSIGGARMISEVNETAWDKLAGDLGFSKRFADSARNEITSRVVVEAQALVGEEAHSNATARQILTGILDRGAA
jgi:serine/threonine-protein kinase HipA